MPFFKSATEKLQKDQKKIQQSLDTRLQELREKEEKLTQSLKESESLIESHSKILAEKIKELQASLKMAESKQKRVEEAAKAVVAEAQTAIKNLQLELQVNEKNKAKTQSELAKLKKEIGVIEVTKQFLSGDLLREEFQDTLRQNKFDDLEETNETRKIIVEIQPNIIESIGTLAKEKKIEGLMKGLLSMIDKQQASSGLVFDMAEKIRALQGSNIPEWEKKVSAFLNGLGKDKAEKFAAAVLGAYNEHAKLIPPLSIDLVAMIYRKAAEHNNFKTNVISQEMNDLNKIVYDFYKNHPQANEQKSTPEAQAAEAIVLCQRDPDLKKAKEKAESRGDHKDFFKIDQEMKLAIPSCQDALINGVKQTQKKLI